MQSVDSKIKGVSIWFYIISAFQVFAAFFAWSAVSGDPALAQYGIVLAAVDLIIGALFVVFGYYAGKKQAWAFVAGLILYAIRALLQFNIIALVIRAFLMFRIFQGLQACLAANRADQALKVLNATPRRLEMPQAPVAPPPPAWIPPRAAQAYHPLPTQVEQAPESAS